MIKLFQKMQKKYDDDIKFKAAMQKYVLLKQALHNDIIYPIDKQYWEELIEIYEYQLTTKNKQVNKVTLIMIKEEYELYLEKLKQKEL